MRISLAGGGTDLPPFLEGVGGRIVGLAVDIRVRATVEPFDPGWVRLELPVVGLAFSRRATDARNREPSARLLEEALLGTGIGDGVRLRVDTDLTPGAGLGGSASAAVAILAALSASLDGGDDEPSRDSLVERAVRVERDGLGLACGFQDQTLAAWGGLLDLRFDARGLSQRTALAADPALLAGLQAGLLLLDTGVRRVSGEVIGRARYAAPSSAELVAAAGEVVDGIAAGSLPRVLAAMRRSAAAKASRDPEANAAALHLAARVEALGAEVVRLCGAGGGGHVLVWAPPATHGAIEAASADLGVVAVRRPAIGVPGVRIERDA
jgi:D-glycero-alpha-D-manno-heptose-7-phosphate kinase